MKIHLETERLILREFTADDVGELMELNSDPEVMRYIDGGLPANIEDAVASVQRFLEGYANHPGFGFFAAMEKPELRFIGWFHFRPDHMTPEYMEIGYRLKQCAWGRGLATEGSRALIEQGRQAGVRLVSGRALKANLASRRVLEKLGLNLAGEYQELRFPGEDKTAVFMRRELAGIS